MDAERAIGASCSLHKYHWPPPLLIEWHHVWPKGMGGPDIPENKKPVCATGHYNVHEAINDLVAGRVVRGGTKAERAMAQAGFDAWVAAGKP